MHTIRPGIKGTSTIVVSLTLAASSVGSGLLDVYATPSMIALMEAAAAGAILPYLAEGQTSVGTSVNIKHIAATPLNETVTATVEVTEVNGTRIVFVVEAHDEYQLIGTGTHVRYVVDADEFLATLANFRTNKN